MSLLEACVPWEALGLMEGPGLWRAGDSSPGVRRCSVPNLGSGGLDLRLLPWCILQVPTLLSDGPLLLLTWAIP